MMTAISKYSTSVYINKRLEEKPHFSIHFPLLIKLEFERERVGKRERVNGVEEKRGMKILIQSLKPLFACVILSTLKKNQG